MSHSRVEHPGESPLDWLQDPPGEGGELEGVWDMHITIVKIDFNYVILGRETEMEGEERDERGKDKGE